MPGVLPLGLTLLAAWMLRKGVNPLLMISVFYHRDCRLYWAGFWHNMFGCSFLALRSRSIRPQKGAAVWTSCLKTE
ncbi:hypothetical protein PO124_29930 [Bacillus licheniformis]|nr:hypothetical protein [Bacillus licheniformis]